MPPIIAVNIYSTYDDQKKAKTLVYRNLDYRDMEMIPYKDLRRGQRVVFIVNSLHVEEIPYFYNRYLKNKGYNPESLQLRTKSSPSLSQIYPFAQDEFVLDITK